MFEIQLGDTKVGVTFKHGVAAWDDRRYTACWVRDVNNSDDRNLFGVTKCSLQDNYSKSVGRKIALTRAVKTVPQWARKAIWDGYWNAHGKVD